MSEKNFVGWLLVGLLSLAPLPAAAQQAQRPGQSQIGVSIRDLREADLAAAKLTRAEGVFIDSVQPGTPAERAGIKSGDIIIEYDRERVRGSRHFARLVQETPAGRAVPLTVNRGGASQSLSVTPEEGRSGSVDLDDLRDRIERNLPDLPFGIGQRAVERRVGLTMVPLSAQLASYFGVGSGVLVSEVVAGSPAAQANVRAGDVITAVNGRGVGSPSDVIERLRAMDAGSSVDLTLMRDKREVRVQVRIGEALRRNRSTVGI